MKKILGLAMAILVVSTATTMVFAKEAENRQGNDNAVKNASNSQGNKIMKEAENREIIKNAIKTQLSPVIHGYGIGFTDSSYITAKWQVVRVRTLSMGNIRSMVARSNTTEWSDLKDDLISSLQANGTLASKGRINIGKTNYLLTNITTTNTTLTADIRSIPNYEACKNSNITADSCEISATKMGSISLAKKTQAIEDESNAKVWAGTLNFNSTSYTFVTFAYPRSEK